MILKKLLSGTTGIWLISVLQTLKTSCLVSNVTMNGTDIAERYRVSLSSEVSYAENVKPIAAIMSGNTFEPNNCCRSRRLT